ncbi:hypothetical protein [Herbiconiux flava]|uniref:DUF1059 domain-containing protein n=1 Tax=Herbiconiux flava TaxID=881268 RepID=A0A852SU31_9MICO|nr:hypothetical protein [Herbiconiux flava]NYD72301.1 hypothetical protein [Herbiconiux flava]GLK17736.1 hypothetical protein GCM10017602_22180 [Herbiconiux flava]
MPIFYDVTIELVTVFCTECSSWFACAWSREEARESAGRHEAQCHPNVFTVRNKIARRAREKASVPPKV